jgi:tetratricopeptide (TPR) repeat protein
MACMNVSVVQYTQAEYLYLSSEKCCKRVLGANHIRTAEVYLDLGKLYWKMGKKDEAHKNIEKSYQIFEKLNDNVQIASSAFQLAIIYQDQRRFGEAMKFSKRASEIYQVLYSVNNMSNETLIISLWLTMCVAFSIGQDTVVLEQGGKILDEIKKRSTAKEINELLNDKIQAIQQKCAIGTIISTIRSQEYKQKRYTILIIEELYRTLEQTLNTTLELKNAFLDSIKLNEYAQKTLSAIIDQAEQYKNGVREYITGVVNGVQKAYGEMKEQPLVDNDNYALSPAIESTEREVLIKVLKMFDKKDLIFVLG